MHKPMSQAPNNSNGEQTTNEPAGGRGSHIRSLDTIFEALVAKRRRNALYVLYRHAGPISLADLADEVASLEGDPTERVATSLHHTHLPKLVEAEVAHYDAEENLVRLTDHSERFREYLTTAAADERRPLRRASESATLSEF
jgi:hypothetical protein